MIPLSDSTDGLTLRPTDGRQLADALLGLRDRNIARHRVNVVRDAMTDMGAPDAITGVIEAGAGVHLSALETVLKSHGLSLGPVPAEALGLTVAGFLEGRLAGLAVVPGGNLVPLCEALEGVTADGRLITASASGGPDLRALFLGNHGRLGLVTRARFRTSRIEVESTFSADFADAGELVALLHDLLEGSIWLTHATVLGLASGARRCTFGFITTRTALDSDRALIRALIARASAVEAVEISEPEGLGHLVSWSGVLRQLTSMSAGQRLRIERLSAPGALISGLHLPVPEMHESNSPMLEAVARGLERGTSGAPP